MCNSPHIFYFIAFIVFLSCQSRKKEEKSSAEKISYEQNLAEMKVKSAQLIAHVRQYKVDEDDELRLNCFFYTDSKDNAEKLSAQLGKMEYPVNAGEYKPEKPWLITAKSSYIKMDEESILKWVDEMCKLGHQNQCVMEGWSVDPKQPRKPLYQ